MTLSCSSTITSTHKLTYLPGQPCYLVHHVCLSQHRLSTYSFDIDKLLQQQPCDDSPRRRTVFHPFLDGPSLWRSYHVPSTSFSILVVKWSDYWTNRTPCRFASLPVALNLTFSYNLWHTHLRANNRRAVGCHHFNRPRDIFEAPCGDPISIHLSSRSVDQSLKLQLQKLVTSLNFFYWHSIDFRLDSRHRQF